MRETTKGLNPGVLIRVKSTKLHPADKGTVVRTEESKHGTLVWYRSTRNFAERPATLDRVHVIRKPRIKSTRP